jgi:hypothetical protein
MKPSFLSGKLLPTVGYVWGALLALGTPLLFLNLDHSAHRLGHHLQVHPVYTGGEIVRTFETNGAKWNLHRPVFDGLVSQRRNGFVQIDIVGGGKTDLRQPVDFDGDGRADFILSLSNKPGAVPEIGNAGPEVAGLGSWARTSDGWIVRVALYRK